MPVPAPEPELPPALAPAPAPEPTTTPLPSPPPPSPPKANVTGAPPSGVPASMQVRACACVSLLNCWAASGWCKRCACRSPIAACSLSICVSDRRNCVHPCACARGWAASFAACPTAQPPRLCHHHPTCRRRLWRPACWPRCSPRRSWREQAPCEGPPHAPTLTHDSGRLTCSGPLTVPRQQHTASQHHARRAWSPLPPQLTHSHPTSHTRPASIHPPPVRRAQTACLLPIAL